MSDAFLEARGIHKTYTLGRSRLEVLRGVDLSVHRGRFAAVVGASGSGKSTLLHVLSGLDVPQRGNVFFEGAPIFEPEGHRHVPVGRNGRSADNREEESADAGVKSRNQRIFDERRTHLLNRRFGFVFQFYHLLPEFDVLENVLLPRMVGRTVGGWMTQRSECQARALRLLEQVGLQDRMRHRPNELSGGERQRVAIARALINEPAVLFADEPTGNLDARTGGGIFGLLQELNAAGQTVVMVTHDSRLADQTDFVVELVDGKVARESGKPGAGTRKAETGKGKAEAVAEEARR